MIQYLSIERCKSNQESKYVKIYKNQNGIYLETALGFRGMYISEDIKRYRLCSGSEEMLSLLFEPLKIYSWPKAIPNDYVPEKHIMGCDEASWSIEYKEEGKRTMRHIHGKGEFPDTLPYSELSECLKRILPVQYD